MSAVVLLHELDLFTTWVQSKTVRAISYSLATSINIIRYRSLRCNLLSCRRFVIPCFSVFVFLELDRKFAREKQIFEKFLQRGNFLCRHGELQNDQKNQ